MFNSYDPKKKINPKILVPNKEADNADNDEDFVPNDERYGGGIDFYDNDE